MKLYRSLKNDNTNDDSFVASSSSSNINDFTQSQHQQRPISIHVNNEYKQFDHNFYYKTIQRASQSNAQKKYQLIPYQKSTDGPFYSNGKQIGSNGKSTEIHLFLLFLFFLFVTIITITQIVIMHSASNSNTNYNQIKQMQEELKLMDTSIDKMLKEKYVLPMQLWLPIKTYFNNIFKIEQFIFDSYISHVNIPQKMPLESVASTSTSSSCYSNLTSLFSYLNEFNLNTSYFYEFINMYDGNWNSDCVKNLLLLFGMTSNLQQITNEQNLFIDNENLKNFIINNSFEYFLRKTQESIHGLHHQDKKLKENPICDPVPSNLIGLIKVNDRKPSHVNMNSVEVNNTLVSHGGKWKPESCLARHKIAIIVPYRDRLDHLTLLLSYLHPLLQRQELEYKIYVVEQSGNGTFNKAVLMNAAFIYAFDEGNYNCVCFHDVDLIPEDDRNMYTCPQFPRHMSVGVDEMDYKLQYEELVGGVLILRPEHVLAVNGFSNLYWGWGAEDDDIYYRIKGAGLKVERPPVRLARYTMIKHQKRKPQLWSKRAKLLYSSVNRMTWDGISSAKYKLINITAHKLYTHLLIDVGEPPLGFN